MLTILRKVLVCKIQCRRVLNVITRRYMVNGKSWFIIRDNHLPLLLMSFYERNFFGLFGECALFACVYNQKSAKPHLLMYISYYYYSVTLLYKRMVMRADFVLIFFVRSFVALFQPIPYVFPFFIEPDWPTASTTSSYCSVSAYFLTWIIWK